MGWLAKLVSERDDVISLAFQNAEDMKDGAMDHPPWEKEGTPSAEQPWKLNSLPPYWDKEGGIQQRNSLVEFSHENQMNNKVGY